MKLKHKSLHVIKNLLLFAGLVSSLLITTLSAPVAAMGMNASPVRYVGAATTEAPLPPSEDDCKDTDLSKDCTIVQYLVVFINILSATVGVVIIAMIILSGIQYSASGDDPQAVAKAKSRITKAILALVVFVFGYALLQWLVPGGIF